MIRLLKEDVDEFLSKHIGWELGRLRHTDKTKELIAKSVHNYHVKKSSGELYW